MVLNNQLLRNSTETAKSPSGWRETMWEIYWRTYLFMHRPFMSADDIQSSRGHNALLVLFQYKGVGRKMTEKELKKLINEAEKWRLNLLELAHMMTFEEQREHGLKRAKILEKLIEIAKERIDREIHF